MFSKKTEATFDRIEKALADRVAAEEKRADRKSRSAQRAARKATRRG